MKKYGYSKKKAALLSLVTLSAAAVGGIAHAGMPGGSCVSTNLTISVPQSPLEFGTVFPCTATAGTVEIRPAGQRSATACLVVSGTFQPAQVHVGGTSGQAIVSVTAATATITAGANTMSVTSFDFKVKGGGPTITLNVPGTTNLGAVLNVAAAQAGGSYSGTFTVNAVCKP